MNTAPIILASALAIAAPNIAGAQDAPPDWNRRVAALEIQESPAGPGLYDLDFDLFFARHEAALGGISLGIAFFVHVNDDPTPAATGLVAVDYDTPSVCTIDECGSSAPCAVVFVEGQPQEGTCRFYPPHPGDDAPWCGCSALFQGRVQQIALEPGDEVVLEIRPADGTMAETYLVDDLLSATVPEPGIRPLCFGDWTGANCPCVNIGLSGQGCKNSTGVGAVLTTFGTASVAADDLWFRAQNLPANQPVLLFYGQDALNGGMGLPFGDGLRCVGTNLKRVGTETATATGHADWGPGLAATFGWAPGDHLFFQDWYRDPLGPCGSGFNLSNAIELLVSP